MLVRTKGSDDPDVACIHDGRLGLRMGDFIGRRIVDRLDLQYWYYPSSFALREHPWFQAATIIQLHNVHGSFFSHRALPAISRHRPVVWRLSDMWPLTGHCSYSHDCERWKSGCGACPYLSEYPSLKRDTTALLWRVKKRVYTQSNLIIVSTNAWMEKLVQESPLLRRFPTFRIPNGVDAEVFHPLLKASTREALNIPASARVVLFIANVARPGTRKGGEYVSDVMRALSAEGLEDLLLLVVGEGAEQWKADAKHRTVRIEFTHSDRLLAAIYSAADVLIHPALVENLPNTVLESMACGTPAVAFDVGGVADVVRHMETGYLAKYRDGADLAYGIRWLLENREVRERMGARCRAVVETEYSNELQARRYVELYRCLIEQRRSR